MATIPSLAGFVAGEAVTAAKLTQHTKTAIEAAVYYRPFCHIYNSAAQSLPNGGAGASSVFSSVAEDTDSMADIANNRIKIVTPGLYRLTANANFASNATGFRASSIHINGTIRISSIHAAASGAVTRILTAGTIRLAANDLVTLVLIQTSGAALNTDNTAGGCLLQAEWVSL